MLFVLPNDFRNTRTREYRHVGNILCLSRFTQFLAAYSLPADFRSLQSTGLYILLPSAFFSQGHTLLPQVKSYPMYILVQYTSPSKGLVDRQLQLDLMSAPLDHDHISTILKPRSTLKSRTVTSNATPSSQSYAMERPPYRTSTHSTTPDEAYTPNPPKAKVTRVTSRGYPVSGDIRVPLAYHSAGGHALFSRAWWAEITKTDIFWKDFEKYVARTTIDRRLRSPLDSKHVKIFTEFKTRSKKALSSE